MKPLSTAASVESEDFPNRFSDTWDRESTVETTTRDRDQEEPGLLTRIRRQLPCDRCWTSLIASAAITAFIVGGVLVIVALLVRHHDEKMEKLERALGLLSTASTAGVSNKEIGQDVDTATLVSIPVQDHCSSHPCLHGATCLNRPNIAHCICSYGYAGQFCGSVNRNATSTTTTRRHTTTKTTRIIPTTAPYLCPTRPCMNGGQCIGATGNCACSGSYTGRFCQNSASGICASSPCMYDTNCTEIKNGLDFECSCPAGLEGKRCEKVTCRSNGTLTATQSIKVISSPDYPNDALPSLNCSWTISASHYFVRLSIDGIHLEGSSCDDSRLDIHDAKSQALIARYCPSNGTVSKVETRGSQLVSIRCKALPGSYFRFSYSSPDVDPCVYFNGAPCIHGKCWPEETKATCVCNPCYRGIGCSEVDVGNCTDTYCANSGTCSYNCFLQTTRCQCTKEYDPRTNCAKKCADTHRC